MPRRGLSVGRRNAKRPRGKRHLICCNGKVTEPQYLNALVSELGKAGLVVVDCHAADKDPCALVKYASKKWQAENRAAKQGGYDSYSRVWAVTDVDDFDIGPAQKLARETGIDLVVSNPCFEVWLIDHMRQCPESCASTIDCERFADGLGVIVPTDPRRKSLSKKKAVAIDDIGAALSLALGNAERHNTPEKRAVRLSDPSNTRKYPVWTDIPDLVTALMDD